jgi:hypothetical protein
MLQFIGFVISLFYRFRTQQIGKISAVTMVSRNTALPGQFSPLYENVLLYL